MFFSFFFAKTMLGYTILILYINLYYILTIHQLLKNKKSIRPYFKNSFYMSTGKSMDHLNGFARLIRNFYFLYF